MFKHNPGCGCCDACTTVCPTCTGTTPQSIVVDLPPATAGDGTCFPGSNCGNTDGNWVTECDAACSWLYSAQFPTVCGDLFDLNVQMLTSPSPSIDVAVRIKHTGLDRALVNLSTLTNLNVSPSLPVSGGFDCTATYTLTLNTDVEFVPLINGLDRPCKFVNGDQIVLNP